MVLTLTHTYDAAAGVFVAETRRDGVRLRGRAARLEDAYVTLFESIIEHYGPDVLCVMPMGEGFDVRAGCGAAVVREEQG